MMLWVEHFWNSRVEKNEINATLFEYYCNFLVFAIDLAYIPSLTQF